MVAACASLLQSTSATQTLTQLLPGAHHYRNLRQLRKRYHSCFLVRVLLCLTFMLNLQNHYPRWPLDHKQRYSCYLGHKRYTPQYPIAFRQLSPRPNTTFLLLRLLPGLPKQRDMAVNHTAKCRHIPHEAAHKLPTCCGGASNRRHPNCGCGQLDCKACKF